jgi:hypothetical protein
MRRTIAESIAHVRSARNANIFALPSRLCAFARDLHSAGEHPFTESSSSPSPCAHAALGAIRSGTDWDWQGSEQMYRRAFALDPNDATAHFWFATNLIAMERFDEPKTEPKRAEELDPLGPALRRSAPAHRPVDRFTRSSTRSGPKRCWGATVQGARRLARSALECGAAAPLWIALRQSTFS